MDEPKNQEARIDRRTILQSIGTASVGTITISGTAAGASSDIADYHEDIKAARENATIEKAKQAFNEIGKDLLVVLKENGYIDEATFESLGIQDVKVADSTLLADTVSVHSAEHMGKDEIVYKTLIPNSKFDDDIFVTIRKFSRKAGATATIDGDPYALTSSYGEFIPKSTRPESVTCYCTADPACCNECKCPENTYSAREGCSDGTEYNCGTCRLSCSPCVTILPCGGNP